MLRCFFALFVFSVSGAGVSFSQDFLHRWDFDQDGINDTVTYEYTGGAHCCYQIKVWTSKQNKVWDFSHYEMDGGYVHGLDDSQPGHFNIKNFDSDSAPEIFIESGTYGGGYSSWSEQVLLDYENDFFKEKSFDIYLYGRDKKKISCSGKNGFLGYYSGWTDNARNTIILNEKNQADFYSSPRGVGGWEINYGGEWKLKDSTLTITYRYKYYLDSPDDHEKLKEPIIKKFVFSKSDCILKSEEKTSYILYYKE